MSNIHKVIVVGDNGVGKTTLLKKLVFNETTIIYLPTYEIDKYSLNLNTNYGLIQLVLWDIPNTEQNTTYYSNADAAIILIDLSSPILFNYLYRYYQCIKQYCGCIPIIIIGTKYDLKLISNYNKINEYDSYAHYYEVSVLTNYNCVAPLMHILKKLTHNDVKLISNQNEPIAPNLNNNDWHTFDNLVDIIGPIIIDAIDKIGPIMTSAINAIEPIVNSIGKYPSVSAESTDTLNQHMDIITDNCDNYSINDDNHIIDKLRQNMYEDREKNMIVIFNVTNLENQLLRTLLDNQFSQYGEIINTYLPTMLRNVYVIEYDSIKSVVNVLSNASMHDMVDICEFGYYLQNYC